jgi:putative FmdB family regulatory protein
MPFYNYECHRHGAFGDWKGIGACADPTPCPVCGLLAPRSVSSPHLGMDSGLRRAHGIYEKSAHEPRVVHRKRGDPIPTYDAHRDLTRARSDRHDHTPGHHGHHHGDGPQRSNHPWMVRH